MSGSGLTEFVHEASWGWRLQITTDAAGAIISARSAGPVAAVVDELATIQAAWLLLELLGGPRPEQHHADLALAARLAPVRPDGEVTVQGLGVEVTTHRQDGQLITDVRAAPDDRNSQRPTPLTGDGGNLLATGTFLSRWAEHSGIGAQNPPDEPPFVIVGGDGTPRNLEPAGGRRLGYDLGSGVALVGVCGGGATSQFVYQLRLVGPPADAAQPHDAFATNLVPVVRSLTDDQAAIDAALAALGAPEYAQDRETILAGNELHLTTAGARSLAITPAAP